MPFGFLTEKQQAPKNVNDFIDALNAIKEGVLEGLVTYDEIEAKVTELMQKCDLNTKDAEKVIKQLFTVNPKVTALIKGDLKPKDKQSFESHIIPPVDLFFLHALAKHFGGQFYIALPPIDMASISQQHQARINRMQSVAMQQIAQHDMQAMQRQELTQLGLMEQNAQATIARMQKEQELRLREQDLMAANAKQSIQMAHEQELLRLHERQAQLEQAEINLAFNQQYLTQMQSEGLRNYRAQYPTIAQHIQSQVDNLGMLLNQTRQQFETVLSQLAQYIDQGFAALNQRVGHVENRVDVLEDEIRNLRMQSSSANATPLSVAQTIALNNIVTALTCEIQDHKTKIAIMYQRTWRDIQVKKGKKERTALESIITEVIFERNKLFATWALLLDSYQQTLRRNQPPLTQEEVLLISKALYNQYLSTLNKFINVVYSAQRDPFFNILSSHHRELWPHHDLSSGIPPIIKSIGNALTEIEYTLSAAVATNGVGGSQSFLPAPRTTTHASTSPKPQVAYQKINMG